MLEGRIELSLGGQSYRLQEGDCLALEIDGGPHSFKNPSRRPARYAVVIALT